MARAKINPEATEKKARKRAAADAIERAVARYGADVVADKIGTTEQTIRNWASGAHLPTPFMAGIVLSKFTAEGAAK